MKAKRLVAILVIFAMLGTGALKPKAARADIVESVVIAAGCLAAYIVIVIVATKIAFGHDETTVATIEDPTLTYQQADGKVHFTERCKQEGGNVTLACW